MDGISHGMCSLGRLGLEVKVIPGYVRFVLCSGLREGVVSIPFEIVLLYIIYHLCFTRS